MSTLISEGEAEKQNTVSAFPKKGARSSYSYCNCWILHMPENLHMVLLFSCQPHIHLDKILGVAIVTMNSLVI